MYQIARKTYLARNLKRMRKLFPNEFKFFPRTWIWPGEANELRQYIQNKHALRVKAKNDTRRLNDPRNERAPNSDNTSSLANKSTDAELVQQ
jgi:hypothetical protein